MGNPPPRPLEGQVENHTTGVGEVTATPTSPVSLASVHGTFDPVRVLGQLFGALVLAEEDIGDGPSAELPPYIPPAQPAKAELS